MTLNRSADAWCSCEFSSGILAQVSLFLLIRSKSEGQSLTYQNLFLSSFLCKSCIKFHIPEMETAGANINDQLQLTLMFSFYINLVSKYSLLVWVSHLDKRRDLFLQPFHHCRCTCSHLVMLCSD